MRSMSARLGEPTVIEMFAGSLKVAPDVLLNCVPAGMTVLAVKLKNQLRYWKASVRVAPSAEREEAAGSQATSPSCDHAGVTLSNVINRQAA